MDARTKKSLARRKMPLGKLVDRIDHDLRELHRRKLDKIIIQYENPYYIITPKK